MIKTHDDCLDGMAHTTNITEMNTNEEAILKSVKKTGCVVTCEEHNKFGGLGESVARLLTTEYLAPQEFVAVNDSFGESATPDQLMTKYKLDPSDIVAAVQKVLKRKI